MKTRSLIFLSSVFAMTLLASGCASDNNSATAADSVVYNTRCAVKTESSTLSRTDTNTVRVVVVFRNTSDNPTSIRCRSSFLNDNLAPVEPASAWQYVHIRPRSSETYSESSGNTQLVTHWRVEVEDGETNNGR